ncbi:ubiquitin-conjugating enzyme E2 D [Enteropsectra breve]|nr:ubiquitin-conjugating enzyme E2 D [Enteropsectra breve]
MESKLRLQNELKNLEKNRKFGFFARPVSKDMHSWICQLTHNGYFFLVSMSFPKTYPMAPPEVKFLHRVYHPNVYADNHICLDLISYKWNPTTTISDILQGLANLMEDPNPLSPANINAARDYKSNRDKYDEAVKKNNDKFHSKYNYIE